MLKFLKDTYWRDIYTAAESDPFFDDLNIVNIGYDHGTSFESVMLDIKGVREWT